MPRNLLSPSRDLEVPTGTPENSEPPVSETPPAAPGLHRLEPNEHWPLFHRPQHSSLLSHARNSSVTDSTPLVLRDFAVRNCDLERISNISLTENFVDVQLLFEELSTIFLDFQVNDLHHNAEIDRTRKQVANTIKTLKQFHKFLCFQQSFREEDRHYDNTEWL